MYTSHVLTSEKQLAQPDFEQALSTWWKQGTFSQFESSFRGEIAYCYFINDEAKQTVVISPGRCEGYLKYQELCYDLYHSGYNVFVIDHRGQGLSDRRLANREKGYVERFDYYSDDFFQFISQTVQPTLANLNITTPIHLLAHSMGCAITLRMLQRHSVPVSSVVLSSPMIRVSSGIIPLRVARMLVSTCQWLNHWLSKTPWYFIGQGNYQARSFSQNHLCSSQVRYQKMLDLYEQVPQLKLGGVTCHWLSQAIATEKRIFAEIDKLDKPITVMQAGAESIVCNNAQNEFCQQLYQEYPLQNAKQPLVVEGAKHELFFEQDSYRHKALNHAMSWMAKHT